MSDAEVVTPIGWVRHLWNRVLFPADADPHTRVRLLSLLLQFIQRRVGQGRAA